MVGIQSPAQMTFGFIPGQVLFLALHLIGLALFAYIVAKRMQPLLGAQRDFRFDRPWERMERVLQYWLGQWRHPRYRAAGIIHILIFAGFILLFARAMSVLMQGVWPNFELPGTSGTLGHIYDMVKDYAATVVFLLMIVCAVRRGFFKPKRYQVPERFGKDHSAD